MMLSVWAIFFALIASLLIAVPLVFSSYVFFIRWKYSHIPSPRGATFFFGHLGELERERRKRTGENPPTDLYLRWASECGSLYVVFIMWRPWVVAFNAKDIETIHMPATHKKSPALFADVFGERFARKSLLVIRDYETWKPRRRMYDPAFSKSNMKSLIPMFGECVDTFLNQLRPLADGKTQVPMIQHFSIATVDVISKVAFTCDLATEWSGKSPDKGHQIQVECLIETIFNGIMKQLRYPFYKYLHPFEIEEYCEAVRALRTIGRECILKRIKALNSGVDVPNDILTCILKVASTDGTADIESLVDEFTTFYVAGQETTANTLSFALLLVHQHPDVLERLLAEIDEVFGNKTTVSAEDLEKLKYTEQIIQETLRLHGPVLATFKDSPVGGVCLSGYHVPEGTKMATIIGATSRMSQHFNDPDTFNPARFDPENQKPSPFIFSPFGVGRRSCIGRHFAMIEAKMIFCRLLQTFEVSLPSDYKICVVQRATVKPDGNVPCTLRLRK